MKIHLIISFLTIASLSVLIGCHKGQNTHESKEQSGKISFDLKVFNDEGLQGPPDGLRSQDYEFCIPAQSRYIEEVREIDSTLAILEQAKGRVACTDQQYLCIGTTHQAGFREVLAKLAEKEYIERIDPCYYE